MGQTSDRTVQVSENGDSSLCAEVPLFRMMTCPQTLKPKLLLGVIIGITGLSVLMGGLARANWLAIHLDIADRLPPSSPYWHIFVAVTGLLLPIMMRIRYRRRPIIRRLLNAYLIVFLAQIVSELILTPIFQRGISVIIGSFYSIFRLVQLGQGQLWVRQARQPRWLRLYLWFLMVVWAINVGRFILYRWPILLR
ncbi:hypothetical protein [Acaryochloris sp. IP29b_bin.137]|uniref:hypothetical protein n=1 Tax=Acaryochloris sp. IP29b_bin.137 TaxID=2969217 RepID=UPI0026236799|nr:hypothetical protein [Acaryochloris sp. IP29b_bin.137]